MASVLDGTGKADTVEEMNQWRDPSIRAIGSKNGRHKGKLITLERTGPTWGSFHSTAENKNFDPQGDPRLFIETIGKEAAEFFGYRQIDDTHIQVPDYREFTNAVKKINDGLRAQNKPVLPIRFYPAPSSKKTVVSDYVKAYQRTGSIPIAELGNHYLHDINFHTSAIFLPPEFVRYTQARIKYCHDFYDFVESKAKTTEEKAAIRYFRFLSNQTLTRQIDNLTGDVANTIVRYVKKTHGEGREPDEYFENLWTNFAPSKPPLADFNEEIDYFRSNVGVNSEKLNRHLTSYSQDRLKRELELFSQSYQSNDPNFSPLHTIENKYGNRRGMNKALCKLLTERRSDILRIALELRRQNSE